MTPATSTPALTIGTLDGANVEIRDAVGNDNFFQFGLNVGEVEETRGLGYRPWEFINLARIRYFSSDRAIREYCEDIWKVRSVSVGDSL